MRRLFSRLEGIRFFWSEVAVCSPKTNRSDMRRKLAVLLQLVLRMEAALRFDDGRLPEALLHNGVMASTILQEMLASELAVNEK